PKGPTREPTGYCGEGCSSTRRSTYAVTPAPPPGRRSRDIAWSGLERSASRSETSITFLLVHDMNQRFVLAKPAQIFFEDFHLAHVKPVRRTGQVRGDDDILEFP